MDTGVSPPQGLSASAPGQPGKAVLVPSLHALREHVTRRIDALEVLHANRLDRLERFLERLAEEHRLLQRRLDTLERELLPRCVRRIEELIGGSRSE